MLHVKKYFVEIPAGGSVVVCASPPPVSAKSSSREIRKSVHPQMPSSNFDFLDLCKIAIFSKVQMKVFGVTFLYSDQKSVCHAVSVGVR